MKAAGYGRCSTAEQVVRPPLLVVAWPANRGARSHRAGFSWPLTFKDSMAIPPISVPLSIHGRIPPSSAGGRVRFEPRSQSARPPRGEYRPPAQESKAGRYRIAIREDHRARRRLAWASHARRACPGTSSSASSPVPPPTSAQAAAEVRLPCPSESWLTGGVPRPSFSRVKSRCLTAIMRNCMSLQKIAEGRSISGVTRMVPPFSQLFLTAWNCSQLSRTRSI
jgi:hypothetical protein